MTFALTPYDLNEPMRELVSVSRIKPETVRKLMKTGRITKLTIDSGSDFTSHMKRWLDTLNSIDITDITKITELSNQPTQVIDLDEERKAKRRAERKASRQRAVQAISKMMRIPAGLTAVPLSVFVASTPMRTFAQNSVTGDSSKSATMHEKMMDAFTPIIELVQSLAYPVALLVVMGGGLFVMIGNSEKGFSMIQRAGLGYVLVMMLPMLLDVLVEAMRAVM